jgi:signal transduction histidine kinase
MDSRLPQSDLLLVLFIGISAMMLLALAFVLFFYFSQQRFQAQAFQAQQKELLHQQQLLLGSIQAQEQERQRLARELHDEVGSKLSVINLGLHRMNKTALPHSEGTMNELFGLVQGTMETTRRIAHELLPPTLEKFGLAMALEELCDHYQGNGTEVVFTLAQNDRSIDNPLISLSFYRAAQELLSNSFKYSEASQVELSLWLTLQEARLSFTDNGKGFDAASPNHQKGLGLQNIESRMRIIGADYQLQSAPKQGVFFQAKKSLS